MEYLRAIAGVLLIIPEEGRDRFVRQARGEGPTLTARPRAAARERLDNRERADRFTSPAELEAFFPEC